MLSEAAIEARRAYQREWRAKNREKVREYHRKWRAANAEHVREWTEQYWERKAAAASDPDREEHAEQ